MGHTRVILRLDFRRALRNAPANMERVTQHSSEIAIVGGGMVGSTLALVLARSGLSVMLIDSE